MPPLSPPRRPWDFLALLLLTSGLLARASGSDVQPGRVPDGGVVVVVTKDFVNQKGGKPRNDPVDIQDDVGGFSTRTRGESTAYPKIYFIPGNDAARFHVVTHGAGTSVSVGRREKLCLVTRGKSTFCLEQILCLSGQGLSGQITCVQANAESELECVESYRKCAAGLVRFGVKAGFRLAPGRINEVSTEQATIYTSRRANEFLQKMLEQGNKQLDERLIDAVRPYGVERKDIYFHTTTDQVRVNVDVKTGPTGPARPLAPGTAMAVQIHQTLIEGGVARFAGRTWTSKEIQSVLKPAMKRAGVKLPTTLSLLDWSITLAKKEPLRLRIENEQFKLAVRLDTFKIDTEVYPAVEITTTYRLKERDGWPLLVREGGVGVRVLEKKKKPDGDQWREEMIELLETALVKEVSLAQVMREDLAPLVRLAGLEEKPRVSANRGWLLAEFTAAPEAATPSQPQAKPASRP